MGAVRVIGAVTVTAGKPTPVYTGPVTAAVSFSIASGIATIVLGAGNLPANGYNGPNGFPTANSNGSLIDLYPTTGKAANGQQVTLWGFTTATYFNGLTVTVLDNNPAAGSFRFYFNHTNVANTADAGNTAPIPVQRYRAVRLEASQSNGTDFVYVGDFSVSSAKYMAALSLTGQLSIVISGDNIPADRIFIDGTANTDKVQVSLIY